jgi:hypothetical protein
MLEVIDNPQVTEEVLTVSDIARELGISRQALYQREGPTKLPEPDYRTANKQAPLWKRSTLEKAGILTAPQA